MDVKPGYKMTEVGVIPEEWNIKPLLDVCRFRGGKAHEQYISDLGKYICVNSKFIATDGNVRKYSTENLCPANQHDVLMVMSDLPNGRALAKAYLVEQNDLFAVNQRVCALTPYKDSAKYLFYALNRHPYFLKFDNGVSQTHLLNGVFRACQIPLPPTKAEQSAIGTALSDTDALIESLEQLIAKKRQIKQGAMQELLTGKRRLPGFTGEWEVRRLGDVAVTDPENLGSNTAPTYEFNYIALEDIDNGILRSYSEQVFQAAPVRARRKLQKEDVLVSTVRPNLKSHFLFLANDGNWVCSTGFCVVRSKDRAAYPLYVFLHMFADGVGRQIDALLTGSSYPAINSANIHDLTIPLPSYDEQTAIGTILSDMDADISALEAKRAKAQHIKRGMMHELLTGRIRLV